MNCTEFRAAIDAAVERREAPASALAEHLADCHDPACRACWEDARFLEPVIASWRRIAGPIDVTADVLTQCRSNADRDNIHPSATVVRPGREAASAAPSLASGRALAALIATAVTLIVVFWFPSQQPPSSRVAVRNGAPRSLDRQDRGRDSGAAYVAYAQSATQIVTDAVVLTVGDSDEMEDARIAPGDIGWEAPWSRVGETMDSVLDEWLEAIPVEAPPS